ncbi:MULTISPECIES: DUF2391 family protein [Halobacteriovorax]|uniref:DUF2391 family protein n=1 Tax=Halobacteriovorax vibrionivorans TaxID=2152716 RepID=A0ABY0IEY7_9BACT|nr:MULTISPECIES: DUF2391 family protein [Halobacteriovorax]AYF43966.1 hypothetical protein BALOs_0956 [Halobacteriovorax sp. BALOs_7]RZF21506.1 DUF2391 family protein [Halobacteriovorax vibrionivorans]TGD48778.1 DUF2391 family protein [Halobacteriovorax sp. Y22]
MNVFKGLKNTHTEIKRINGYLKEVVTFLDDSGKPMGHVINPLMVELRLRDITQIFVGAFLVASPLCFTEEVWTLSETLPFQNIYYLFAASITTVTFFVYFNFYRFKLKGNVIEFLKRIFAIYFITTLSVVMILFLINKFPVKTDHILAFKRTVIIAFPSIFGAAVTDYLK